MGSGGDRQIPSGSESTASMMNALIYYLPELTKVVSEQILPSEQAQLAATQEIAPQITQLQTDLYSQYGPALAEAATGVENAANAARAGGDADILSSIGPEIANAALAMQSIIEPEFINDRARISQQLGALNMSPELSPGEMTQIERAQREADQLRGISNAPSNTRAAESLLNYGDALFNKKLGLSNALSQQAGIIPAFRLGFDPIQATLGRPSLAPGVANSQFVGVGQQAIGDNANQLGLGLLSEAGANQRQYASGQTQLELASKDIFDKVLAATGSIGSIFNGYGGGGSSGGGGGGGAAAGAAASYFSDARLKQQLQYLFTLAGQRIYSWLWNDEAKKLGLVGGATGVLAQEVLGTRPDCVVANAVNGYLMVNYQKLFTGV